MIGLSINESTRTAALDGALSFSILVQNQRELTLSSAQSSVSGLLSAIRSAPANFAPLLEATEAAANSLDSSATQLRSPAWTGATSTQRIALADALDQSFANKVQSARALLQNALNDSTSARNQSTNPSTERSLGDDLVNTGNDLLSALAQLDAHNEAVASSQIAAARTDLNATRLAAQNHLASLQSQTPQPTQRIADTLAVISAAQDLLSSSASAETIAQSSLASTVGETPTSYQLTSDTPPATFLATWGDSGIISLTDASGAGILISPDGRVDALPPSGDGWQFQTDATFLLADGTKISISPGSPASLLATRGQQRLAIGPLASGQTPSSSLNNNGGLAADAARNDGYIFNIGPSLGQWTLSGSALGDTSGSREVVATTPLTNEQPVDVTLTTIPPDLLARLQSLGVDPAVFDTDQDGKLNNTEWQAMVTALDAAVEGAQTRFDQALGTTSTALEALLKLNQFIEKILDEADRRQSGRQQVSSEERDQLQLIQRDLVSALNALRQAEAGLPATTPAPVSDVLTVARTVLNQLDATPADAPPTPGGLASSPSSTRPPASTPTPDSLPSATPAVSVPATALSATTQQQPPLLQQLDPASPLDPFKSVSDNKVLSVAPAPFAPAPDGLQAAPIDPAPLLQSFRRAERLLSRPIVTLPGFPASPPLPPLENNPPLNALNSLPRPTPQPPAVIPPDTTPVPLFAQPQIPLPVPRPATEPTSLPSLADTIPDLPRRIASLRSRYQDQLARSESLQGTVRQVVERFLTLVLQDADLRQVFQADNLSDDQRANLQQKTVTLERELGITWGGDPGKTPQADAALATRILTSGMKI